MAISPLARALNNGSIGLWLNYTSRAEGSHILRQTKSSNMSVILPTEALLARVREAIAPNTPINDDWQVRSPDPVPVAVAGTLELVSGDPARILVTADARIRALFADISEYADVFSLQIGEDLTIDRLTHTVMALPGVKRVLWTLPTIDLNVNRAGLAVLESLALHTRTAEEL